MKNRIFPSLLCLAVLICSCIRESDEIQVESVTLDKTVLNMAVGDNDRLTATVAPVDADNKSVTWTSTHEDIATVSNTGTVIALQEGHTVIVAKASSNGISSFCEVEVYAQPVPIQYLKLSNQFLNLLQFGADTLSYTVFPENTTEQVCWSSSNDSVAIVIDGAIIARNVGETTIYAQRPDGNVLDSCKVSVLADVCPLEKIELAKHEINMFVMNSDTIDFQLFPANTTEGKLQWTSSDNQIAVVNCGIVTALREGQVTIYVSGANGGVSDSCIVSVAPHTYPLQALVLSKHDITLFEMESDTLTCTLSPKNTTENEIQWISDDNHVAVVNNGIVTALRAGNTTVRALGAGGRIVDECDISVLCKVSGVTLSKHEDVSETGRTIMLTATVYPSRAENKQVRWKSSNEQVATVNNGTVKTDQTGDAFIIVTTVDGEYSDSCLLTVVNPVSGLSIDSTKVSLFEGDDFNLKAIVEPSDARNKEISWVSSDSSVATVIDGNVHAVKAGQATIVAVTREGGHVRTCAVFVYKHVSDIKFDFESDSVALYKDESMTLSPIVLPDEAPNKELAWSTSNPDAVAVDQLGKITAKGQGIAVVTATSKDNPEISASIVVRVKKHVEDIAVECVSQIYEGESFKLKTIIYPADADDRGLSYSSDNDSVVTVDADGTVRAVRAGSATLTVVSNDGGKTSQCVIAVLCHVSSVKFETPNITGYVNTEIPLNVIVLPERATNKNVKWESSNEDVAMITNKGKLRLWAPGEATVTVTSEDNPDATATLNVKVSVHSESVVLDKTAADLFEGESLQLNASIEPYNDPSLIEWSSGNESIATVSSSGLVQAIALGTVTVRAQAKDNPEHYATCNVNVKRHVKSVSISSSTSFIYKGTTFQYKAVVSPSDASDKSVIWTSSDESVATVDRNGVVNGVGVGYATITVTTNDLGFTASKRISVEPCIDKVEASPSSQYMEQYSDGILTWYLDEGAIPLQATVYPSDYPNRNVTWSSNMPSVVDVVNGQIMPKSAGTAVLTVTTEGYKNNNEPATATITVRVREHVSSVSLSESELSLYTGDTYTLIPTVLPSSADDNVTWGTSNPLVVRVDGGVLTAVSPGTATITVITLDGYKTASCKVSVQEAITRITSISFENSNLTLKKGSTVTLAPVIMPAEATKKELHWEVSNPDVIQLMNNDAAQVSVKALDYGENIEVRATANDGSAIYAVCTITVPKVAKIELNPSTLTIPEKGNATLTATVLPLEAFDRSVTWSSDDPAVATVTGTGNSATVIAVASGSTTIRATANDGSRTVGICTVEVLENVLVKTIRLLENGLPIYDKDLFVGDTYPLPEPQINPENATNKELKYQPEQGGRITYNNGVVKAVRAGESSITISAMDGGGAYCQLNFHIKNRSVESVSLNKESVTVKPGSTFTLVPSISPSNATVQTVTWKSDNNSVATVTSKGVVTAIGEGETYINVTTTDGGKTAKCKVTVANVSTGEDVSFEYWN